MSKTSTPIVTLDGPSASGKSTMSRELAKYFGWKWLSTGAFYRGLTLASQKLNIDSADEARLEKLCFETETWSIKMAPERTRVYFQGDDVTDLISQESVGFSTSAISQLPKVRKALLEAQRNCVNGVPGLVAEGRDCGTVVFPDAVAKIYLTANLENRVQRRATELGLETNELNKMQKQRDDQDANRKEAPMKTPEGALVLDTTGIDLATAVKQVIAFVEMKLKS